MKSRWRPEKPSRRDAPGIASRFTATKPHRCAPLGNVLASRERATGQGRGLKWLNGKRRKWVDRPFRRGRPGPDQAKILSQYIKDLSFENPNVRNLIANPGDQPQSQGRGQRRGGAHRQRSLLDVDRLQGDGYEQSRHDLRSRDGLRRAAEDREHSGAGTRAVSADFRPDDDFSVFTAAGFRRNAGRRISAAAARSDRLRCPLCPPPAATNSGFRQGERLNRRAIIHGETGPQNRSHIAFSPSLSIKLRWA